MTKLKLTRKLDESLEGLPHCDTIRSRQWITTNDLLYLHSKHLSHIPLRDLIQGLEVYHPPKPSPKYSPEFKKQLDRLRVQLEEKEYQEIVNRGKLQDGADYVSPSEMAKEIRSQITTIVNVLVSVGSVITAIWWWTEWMPIQYRMLLCLFFGILVLVADVVVFNAFLRKVDEARAREKRKKEYKKVIETVVIKKDK